MIGLTYALTLSTQVDPLNLAVIPMNTCDFTHVGIDCRLIEGYFLLCLYYGKFMDLIRKVLTHIHCVGYSG